MQKRLRKLTSYFHFQVICSSFRMFPLLSSKNSPAHFTDRSSWVHARCEFRQNYRPRIRPGIKHDKWDSVVCVTLSFVQTYAKLLDVTGCVRLHTLLHVVAQSLKPVKVLSQQLPTFLLFRDLWPNNVRICCVRLHVVL